MLNSDSSIPLYIQLKQAITENINRGVYLQGEKLPTETELCEAYNVSRITVRKAVLDLVDEGLLVRQQGKGTFVKRPKLKRELVSVNGYSEYMVSSGNKPHHKLLSYTIKEASKDISEKLNIPIGCNVLELRRILYRDKEPLSYEISTYALDLFPDLDKHISENVSMHGILRDIYDVAPAHNNKVLNVVFASVEEARALSCGISDPLYELEKIAYNDEQVAIYMSILYYHTNHVSFTISSPFDQK